MNFKNFLKFIKFVFSIYAVEHLTTDLHSYNTDVAVITESHLKLKHTDNVVAVPDYTLLRRDSQRRRGGGVALYVRTSLPSSVELLRRRPYV